MKKYLLISVLFHLWALFFFNKHEKIPPKKEIKFLNVRVNTINLLDNLDSDKTKVANTQTTKPQEAEKIVEKQKDTKIQKKANQPIKKVETHSKTSTISKKKLVESKNESQVETSITNSGTTEFSQDNINLSLGSDGIYTATSPDGIFYEILNNPDPIFPILAKKTGFKGNFTVKTRFLIDTNGDVSKIEILSDKDKFGFASECEKILKKWKFKPIVYNGKNIKMIFYKDFTFSN